jgi:glycosyltransferase involved in cell wall biosynthesis
VIIPVFNSDTTVEACVVSVLHQTYRPLEVIIVDDGSTDRTPQVLTAFGDRIGVIHQSHAGAGVARNTGATRARGEILAFVDADMVLTEDYILKITEPIIKRETVGTDHGIETVGNPDNIWAYCWGRKRVPEGRANSTVFRAITKAAFEQAGGFDPAFGYYDDQTLSLRLGAKATVVRDARCLHYNPSSLRSSFRKSIWIGKSHRHNPFGPQPSQSAYVAKKGWVFAIPLLAIAATVNLLFTLGIVAVFGLLLRSSYRIIQPLGPRRLPAGLLFVAIQDAGFLLGFCKDVAYGFGDRTKRAHIKG